jgi:hypothetical protein
MNIKMLLIPFAMFSACTVPNGRVWVDAEISCPGKTITVQWENVSTDAVITFVTDTMAITPVGNGMMNSIGTQVIQPMENGRVTITDSRGSWSIPITLVPSMPPPMRLLPKISAPATCTDEGLSGNGLIFPNKKVHQSVRVKGMTPRRDNTHVTPPDRMFLIAGVEETSGIDVWAGSQFAVTTPLYPGEVCHNPTSSSEFTAPGVLEVGVKLECQ